MMARLLAERRTNQAKAGANLKEMKEEMTVRLEAKIDGKMAKLDTHHERMMGRLDFQLEKIEACLEKTEATDLEANLEEIESESEHQEVPNEGAPVGTVGAQEDRLEDQRPAVVCRNPRKRRTKSDFARGTPEGPMVGRDDEKARNTTIA
jgi:hypothetical protein